MCTALECSLECSTLPGWSSPGTLHWSASVDRGAYNRVPCLHNRLPCLSAKLYAMNRLWRPRKMTWHAFGGSWVCVRLCEICNRPLTSYQRLWQVPWHSFWRQFSMCEMCENVVRRANFTYENFILEYFQLKRKIMLSYTAWHITREYREVTQLHISMQHSCCCLALQYYRIKF